MQEQSSLVRIFDEHNNFIASGRLMSWESDMVKIKGEEMPILPMKKKVIINIYDELSGIRPYECTVSIASSKQLTATIQKSRPIIERRTTLKVRTDLVFDLQSVYRNHDYLDISEQNYTIALLNLSIGGMLISSDFDLMIDDVIEFRFISHGISPLFLNAKIVRVDTPNDFHRTRNYGCKFVRLASNDENVICKYIFERQLQVFKKR